MSVDLWPAYGDRGLAVFHRRVWFVPFRRSGPPLRAAADQSASAGRVRGSLLAVLVAVGLTAGAMSVPARLSSASVAAVSAEAPDEASAAAWRTGLLSLCW